MKRGIGFVFIAFSVLVVNYSCNKQSFSSLKDNDEMLSGGSQTVFDESSKAYTHSFNNLPSSLALVHSIGDVNFEQTFVSAPAPKNAGLGPLFNNVSCLSCHINDGRGKVPGVGESAASILYRISLPGKNNHGGPIPVPDFGDQLQDKSTQGTVKEAEVQITHTEIPIQLADGSVYSLRKPIYNIMNAYRSISNVQFSPRVASPVFGLGLLEAVSEFDLLSNADEFDANQDGISGKPNYVWNIELQRSTIGRFGWKANQPTILQQVAAAYNGDMGITTFLFPFENSVGQIQFDNINDDVELSDSILHQVAFYIQTLAVPGRRNVTNDIVQKGKQLFIESGCSNCHLPILKTSVNVAFPSLSNQTIRPYTDLLLHDMGEGLADQREDFLANGSEWRTPPLWGIGLTQKVNGHSNFLHDGRARNLLEAILWHDGEAKNSKQSFSKLKLADRNALIKFLESL